MPRTIWTKPQNEPNGTWSRHEGEPPFSIPATGGTTYDVLADTGENFIVTALTATVAPELSGEPAISGIPEVNQSLTAAATSSTGTAPIITTWQWLRDGIEIPDAISATYTLVSADEGRRISVRQTDTNAYGSDSATSAALTVKAAHEVPVLSGVPATSGIPEVNQTLTATAAPSIGTQPITTTLQWLRDGVEIPDATGATYTLVSADAKTDISVRQTDINAHGSDSATSEVLTIREAPASPMISGTPTLPGTAQVGQMLTAAAAPVTGTAPITTTWQWLRDGVEISGATGGSHSLFDDDAGTSISARQTATNAYGSVSATSAALTIQTETNRKGAMIAELSVSDQDPSGEISLVYTITGESVVSGVLTRSATTPNAEQVIAGLDHNGDPADSVFTDNWTISGNDTLPEVAAGLPSDTYHLHVLPDGGGDSDVITSNGFALESVFPTVTSAATSTEGNRITLALSEEVFGTPDPLKWRINGVSAGAPTIGTPVISGNTITLPITNNLISGGDTITVDYAGGDVRDKVSNALVDISGQAVQNNVPLGYAEKLVTVSRGNRLDAPSVVPNDTNALLFFFSGLRFGTASDRSVLLDWNISFSRIYSRFVGGVYGNFCGLDVKFRANKGVGGVNETIPNDHRYHALVSCWAAPANDEIRLIGYLRDADAASPAWFEAFNATQPGIILNALEDLTDAGGGTARTPRLFVRRDNDTDEEFEGQVARIAAWTNNGSAPIADISLPSVRDWFVNPATDTTVDPAKSHAQIGMPQFDFNGPASRYNAGNHDGLLGSFTKNGTFS